MIEERLDREEEKDDDEEPKAQGNWIFTQNTDKKNHD